MAIRSRNKVSVAFSMSSMTDIVFLLLIFFIIVSTMVTPNALKVLLPKSASKATSPKTVAVAISEDNKFYVNNQLVSPENLESKIVSEMGQAEKKGIILSGDQRSTLEYAVKVMDIANRHHYEFILATRAK
ncbi:biopolymer transporter ExbD [bacterium SCSIO 12741]|nr:biopolymer transporter ExbD [bacterium SCSIO 12741]